LNEGCVIKLVMSSGPPEKLVIEKFTFQSSQANLPLRITRPTTPSARSRATPSSPASLRTPSEIICEGELRHETQLVRLQRDHRLEVTNKAPLISRDHSQWHKTGTISVVGGYQGRSHHVHDDDAGQETHDQEGLSDSGEPQQEKYSGHSSRASFSVRVTSRPPPSARSTATPKSPAIPSNCEGEYGHERQLVRLQRDNGLELTKKGGPLTSRDHGLWHKTRTTSGVGDLSWTCAT